MEAKCITSNVVSEMRSQEKLWEIYFSVFTSEKKECIQEQTCIKKENFFQIMVDSDWKKYLLYTENKLVGFGISTNNLEKTKIAYINPEALKRAVKKFLSDANLSHRDIHYIPAIVISKEYRHNYQLFIKLVKAIEQFVCRENNGLVAYDYDSNLPLADMITQALTTTSPIPKKIFSGTLGSQIYGIHLTI